MNRNRVNHATTSPRPEPDEHAQDWAGGGFSLPGPTEADEARQMSDAEAWGGRGPSASYAQWLAEGREAGQ
jgi:hypothetical protein